MNKKRFVILGVLLGMAICGMNKGISYVSKPINPVSMVTETTISLNAEKQIRFGNFCEDDFTCTGMTYDTKDNAFWIADYGAQSGEDVLTTRLVEIDSEFKKVIDIINLEQLVDDTYNLQGVSYDLVNDTLWIATGNLVYEINKMGIIESIFEMGKYAKYQANGIAVNGDDIWVLCYEKYLLKLDRQGNIIHRYKFGYLDQDQIYLYNNKIYCTVGADYAGNDNFVFKFDLDTEEIENEYRLEDSHAIEGIVIKDGHMYIANDGKFHDDVLGYSYISDYKLE